MKPRQLGLLALLGLVHIPRLGESVCCGKTRREKGATQDPLQAGRGHSFPLAAACEARVLLEPVHHLVSRGQGKSRQLGLMSARSHEQHSSPSYPAR